MSYPHGPDCVLYDSMHHIKMDGLAALQLLLGQPIPKLASKDLGELYDEIWVALTAAGIEPSSASPRSITRRFPDIYALNQLQGVTAKNTYALIMHLKACGCDTIALESTHYRSYNAWHGFMTGT